MSDSESATSSSSESEDDDDDESTTAPDDNDEGDDQTSSTKDDDLEVANEVIDITEPSNESAEESTTVRSREIESNNN